MRFPAAIRFLLVFLLAAVPARAEETTVEKSRGAVGPGGGGEIRMVLTTREVPAEYTASGLVTVDSTGRVVRCLAEAWNVEANGTRWLFAPASGWLTSESRPLTETMIVASLRSARTRRALGLRTSSIWLESGAIFVRTPRIDPTLPRRLSWPEALIRVPGRATTGPFRVASSDSTRVTLVPNPHAPFPGRPDTLQVLFEPDPARAVYLVEAGMAEIAPVGDEDFARLLADPHAAGRLVPSRVREEHVLVSKTLSLAALLALSRAVDRDVILRMLMNSRGFSSGPSWRTLSESEKRGLPRVITIAEPAGRPELRRVVQRVAYDLRRSGLRVETTFDTGRATLEYAVRFETDPRPSRAAHLYSVTPYWFVSRRVGGFAPPNTGYPAAAFAEILP